MRNVLAEHNQHRKQGSTSTVALRRCFDGPRAYIPPRDAINATEFHRFFDAKVDGVREQL